MRSKNLMVSAVCSIVLIVGVAWLGNGRPPVVSAPQAPKPPSETPFPLPLDEVTPVDAASDPAKPDIDVQRPELQDTPSKPALDSITVPLEPPFPVIDIDPKLVRIPGGRSLGPGEHAFDPSQLDMQAVPTYQARPVYPSEMRSEGFAGEVLVDFYVDTKGAVRNVRAIRSSRAEFEDAACSAVSKWKFKPGRRAGRAVLVHMQVPIEFSLDDSP